MYIRIKNYLKSLNKFEMSIFLASILLIVVIGLILNCELLTISVAFLGIFSALNRAKGLVLWQITGVILAILYSIISYKNKYFGEVIIYTFIMLPIYLSSTYTWIEYRDKKTQELKQNNLQKKEIIILLIVNICSFFLLYYILKLFGTSQLLISTISILIKLDASYLLLKRCKYNFIFYILSAIILLILWGAPVLNGSYKLLPMVFDAILLIINNIYGLYKWSKRK